MHGSSTFRFAHVSGQALAWRLRRNCSVTPGQLGSFYASVCVVSAVVGLVFWLMGARLVMAFAGLELLALSQYALVAMQRDNRLASEAAMKFFVLGARVASWRLFRY